MKHLFPEKKKNPTLESIKALSRKIMSISESRLSYARNLRRFAERLNQLITSVVPSEADKFKTLAGFYIEAASVNEELAASENRTSEDIRDLLERFAVVTRTNDAYQKQTDVMQDKSHALIDAMATEIAEQKKPTYEKVRYKIEEKVGSAKAAKNASVMELKESIRHLISEKEKYNKFKVRRLEHAWTTYADDHARLYAKEQEVMENIVQFLSNESLPTEVLSEAVQIAESAPAPEEEPQAPELLADADHIEAAPPVEDE